MIEILNGTRETVSYQQKIGIRLFLNQKDENYPVHWHTATEIIMPVKNDYTVIVNDTRYQLNQDDILIIPPGELHELFAPESGERIILQFDFSLLYNLNGFDSVFHLFHPCKVITGVNAPNVHENLKQLLLQIMDEYFSNALLKEGYAYSLLIQFFVILARNCMNGENRFPNTKSHKQHEYIEKFLKVCNYINEHCMEDIPVNELASLAGFSKYHFMRLFKQFTGMSYYNYLNEHRIMQAEKLLTDPNLTITEAAMRSGFLSLATFNRVFKTYKKCTPTDYRLLHGTYPAKYSSKSIN